MTDLAMFQQIPFLTILPCSTNTTLSEFIACIIQSSQQDFPVDGTYIEEPTSYVISILTQFRPEWVGICNNHSLGNSLVEVHNYIGGPRENICLQHSYSYLYLEDMLSFSF